MINKYSKNAKYDNIKFDLEAVKFHADKFLEGAVYPLARQCFQLEQTLKNRSVYQIFLDEQEKKYVSNS